MNFTEWKKAQNQALRVYRDSSDETGRVLCRDHRESYYTLNPAAFGTGEFGGHCETCRDA